MTQDVPVCGDRYNSPPAKGLRLRTRGRLRQQRAAADYTLTSERATQHTPIRGGRHDRAAAESAVVGSRQRLTQRRGVIWKAAKVTKHVSARRDTPSSKNGEISGVGADLAAAGSADEKSEQVT